MIKAEQSQMASKDVSIQAAPELSRGVGPINLTSSSLEHILPTLTMQLDENVITLMPTFILQIFSSSGERKRESDNQV